MVPALTLGPRRATWHGVTALPPHPKWVRARRSSISHPDGEVPEISVPADRALAQVLTPEHATDRVTPGLMPISALERVPQQPEIGMPRRVRPSRPAARIRGANALAPDPVSELDPDANGVAACPATDSSESAATAASAPVDASAAVAPGGASRPSAYMPYRSAHTPYRKPPGGACAVGSATSTPAGLVPIPRPAAPPPPSTFSVATTMMPGAPSILPDMAHTAADFTIPRAAGGGAPAGAMRPCLPAPPHPACG